MAGQLVGWQNGDATRGTFEIIKTCAATIFACTWSVQHLNVPALHDGRLRSFLRACKWMLVTILLPELILAHAILEFAMALECMDQMEAALRDGPGPREIEVKYPSWLTRLRKCSVLWSTRRAALGRNQSSDSLGDEEEQRRPDSPVTQPSISPAGTSWSSVISSSASSMGPTGQSSESPSRKHTWTLTHAYFANMGGLVYTPPPGWSPPGSESPTSKPAARPLTGTHLATYLGFVQSPAITEDEIKDRSKTDTLGKIFSVFQICHLILSLIVRRAQGLPISQLEVLTLAFAVCGVATYAIYWYKPKDVSVPVDVGEPGNGCSPDDQALASHNKSSFQTFRSFDSFWSLLVNDAERSSNESVHRVPNDNIPLHRTGFTHTATFLLAFVSAVFSSLHAVAWNFDFPTTAEGTIWHVCTILTILLPPLGLLGIPLSQATWRQGNPQDFLYASVRVLRELGWQLDSVEERREVDMARHTLETAYHQGVHTQSPDSHQRYKDLLWPDNGTFKNGPSLRQKMLDFVDKKEPFQNRPDLDLPRNYASHLRQLFLLVDGQGSKKMVEKVARTNIFPRRSLPTAFNSWFVYVAMGSYCLARLLLVAVGLSSLRAMPQGVYNATWADYIPAI